MRPLVHIDTFSGIGGFALAAHWAGFETRLFCEIEEYPRRVLARHWPDVPCHDDIRTLTTDTVRRAGIDPGDIALITGGFPCQDISAAGKGAGLEGKRSGLWFHLLRLIQDCRPTWVVLENSPVLRVRGSDIVLAGLEREGYTCWPIVVGADNAGAPHIRKRVFIVACLTQRIGTTGVGIVADSGRAGRGPRRARGRDVQRDGKLRVHSGRKEGAGGPEPCGEALADPNSSGRIERCGAGSVRAAFTAAECGSECPALVGVAHKCRCPGDDRRRPGSQPEGRCAQLAFAGSPDNAAGATFAGLGGTADGLPGRLDYPGWPARPGEAQHPWEPPRTGHKIPNRAARLKGLGNAVVLQVVYPILATIADYEMTSL